MSDLAWEQALWAQEPEGLQACYRAQGVWVQEEAAAALEYMYFLFRKCIHGHLDRDLSSGC